MDEALAGVFKKPSLRNVAMTAPDRHDGCFATLEEVINHYDSGINKSPNPDDVFKSCDTGETIRLGFSEGEKSTVVASLHSLSDENYLNEVRFLDHLKM